ncbi:MAG: tetratricopeptide repeat protein [Phycisphaerae bacterium]|jgi:tetratricopeptide (TPR) repeat protein
MRESSQMLIDKGLKELRQENWPAALAYFQKATEENPDDAEAYYNLGVTYGSLGRYQDAIEAYKQAIRIKPDYAKAHNMLGVTYFAIGDNGAALEEYKILKTLDAELANKLFNLINK